MTRIKNWTLGKYVAVRHIGIEDAMHREEGQGLAEYGLILALIAVACVAALGFLGTGISGTLSKVTGNL
jgi:pilus assembly protein Flp/PilA